MINLQQFLVKYIYADHNSSPSVRKSLKKCLELLDRDDAIGLNVGSSNERIHSKLENLDIYLGENIDIVGSVESIPRSDDYYDFVMSQETLEHVSDPFKAVKEVYRVLKKGGVLYLQLPFIIGYHPGPNDYWRFTKEGIKELVEREGFTITDMGITVGGASGYYRISVEFWSCLFSIFVPIFYKPVKALFSILLYPIKILDLLFRFSKQKDRIPGGYYLIAIK